MYAVTSVFLLLVAGATALSHLRDPGSLNFRALFRSPAALRRSAWLSAVARRVHDYHRRDVHPDDYDNAELTSRWRTTLFGADGQPGLLAPRLTS